MGIDNYILAWSLNLKQTLENANNQVGKHNSLEIKNNPALKRKKKTFKLINNRIFPFWMTSRYVAGAPPHLHVHVYKWRVDITILLRNIIGCSFKNH